MGIRDYFIPESFINALKKEVKGFKDISTKHQIRMASYVWNAGLHKYRHKKHDGHTSIYYLDLEKEFGRGIFKTINDNLNIFKVTPNWSWSINGNQLSSKGKATKGYSLTQHVQNIKDKYLAQLNPEPSNLITLAGKVIRTLPASIAAKDIDGVTASAWNVAKHILPSSIPVDLDRMSKLHAHLKIPRNKTGDLFHDAQVDEIAYRLEIVGQLIRLAHTTVAGEAFIAHRYIESRAGRLYATGVSLQTAPRTIRSVALHGLYDYDIANCHYAIFQQLAARYGYKCNAINYYLTNKQMVRDSLAASVGITVKQVKQCLLALMYGARRTEWHENAIPEEIGITKAELLYANPQFISIGDEILIGRKLILRKWEKGKTTLSNDMDKKIKLSEPPNKRLAHLIQGLEAKALRAAFTLYPDNIMLLMHDGFVSTRQLEIPLIEKAIYDETGLKLEIEHKIIQLPADYDL